MEDFKDKNIMDEAEQKLAPQPGDTPVTLEDIFGNSEAGGAAIDYLNFQPEASAPRKRSRAAARKAADEADKKRRANKSPVKIVIARVLIVLLTFIVFAFATLYLSLNMICKGPSQAASDLFVTTVLESGKLKFVASIFLSEEEISAIVAKTSMQDMDTDINDELITTDGDSDDDGNYDENGIELVEVAGRTFSGKILIVKDPSKVCLATTYPWSEYGQELMQLVNKAGAVAGVNGGLYQSDANKGGRPLGVAVSNGEIQYNNPSGWKGLYMIGFDNQNILRVVDIEGHSASSLEKLIKEMGIRDAVAFQDEASDANNHFVPLIINGVPRELNGAGSGANPRTAIGQRADGSVLLLVTDGRGSGGHLGATASDLISIMAEYGAVNAANLDGGSSSCMVYGDNYEMTSVTLYYANASWKLPTAFVVKGGE